MKKSCFPESQIMAILKLHEADVSFPELALEHKVSTATIYSICMKDIFSEINSDDFNRHI